MKCLKFNSDIQTPGKECKKKKCDAIDYRSCGKKHCFCMHRMPVTEKA